MMSEQSPGCQFSTYSLEEARLIEVEMGWAQPNEEVGEVNEEKGPGEKLLAKEKEEMTEKEEEEVEKEEDKIEKEAGPAPSFQFTFQATSCSPLPSGNKGKVYNEMKNRPKISTSTHTDGQTDRP